MVDARAGRGIPERFQLPPPPQDEEARRRWDALPLERQRELARVGPEDVDDLDPDDRDLVVALSITRVITAWRLLLTPPLLGLVVVMTVWGFGQSTAQDADLWFWIALALGVLVWFVGAFAGARRLRRARQVVAAATR